MKLYSSLLDGYRQCVSERVAIRVLNLGFSVGVIFATFLSSLLHAQPVFPPGFSAMRMATGTLTAPVAAALAPDGRFFIAEQAGNVRIIKNNVLLATPFVSLTVDSQGERGMVGIAVDPDFLVNKYIYVYYTVPGSSGVPARNRISRFTATNDTATPGSGTVILDLDPLGAALIHNGGALHFGKDGKLYVAVGENSVGANAQNLDTYHGKLLRINKDGSAPPDNPFPTGSAQRRRVWAYGLRNPFTFNVDQETGKIFVNDVGGSAWEEVNDATLPGRNFGWPSTEGKFNQASFPTLTNPAHAYAHGTGDGVGCAIVGGAFISPSNPIYPAAYRGKYLFQESCNNWLNILDLSGPAPVRSPFATQVHNNSLGLMTEIDGYMYYLHRGGGALYKIVYTGGIQPTITNQPANVSVVVGQPATFSVTAVGSPPLAYQWQKNSVNIPGATSASFTIGQCTLANSGNYRVIVTNAGGSATSNVATLTVIDNQLPTAEILTPTGDDPYIAGTTINFSGRGTDPEDGQLPPASMTWHIDFHHDTHHHDEAPRVGISSGSFTIPQVGETSSNVWYRITLEVTDSQGFTSEDFVEIFPLKSTLSFNTNPAGLQILLDGQPFATPGSVVSVEGTIRTIGTPLVQNLGNEAYVFESWAHGGAQNQNITTPSQDITYTANFKLSETSFYRAINLNGQALSIDGNNFEAMTGAANFSYTTDRGLFANQAITLIPATDANRASMIRSSIWGYNVALTVGAVPAGTYQVYVYVWEDSIPQTFSVSMEGA
ncbi:MAG TPA: PQQ-dependent sugar dehydrogenase, partial [Anaerolineales bacterium]|nr:PQQ-dependent sugar dehydrogenase [Anaerolineales bacterium]